MFERECSKCGKVLPETQNNFYVRDKQKGTFRRECIRCSRAGKPKKKHRFGIYRITSPSGKVYIGKDQYFPQRMVNHRHISRNKKKTEHNSPIHLAIRKYGWENMIVEGIDFEAKSVDELAHREEVWIWLSNSKKKGYNQTHGGEGTTGFKHSDKTKKLISKKATGRKQTPEQKRNASLANIGRKHSEETKQKMSVAQKGKIVSDQQKRKQSKAMKGRRISEAHIQKIQTFIDREVKGVPIPEERRLRIKESHLNSRFELVDPEENRHEVADLATFAQEHGLATQHLYKVFNGKRKHHKGWTEKFLLKQGEEYTAPPYIEKRKLIGRLVAQISEDGEIIDRWYSIAECARSLSENKKEKNNLERGIGKVLRGERKQTRGMKFKYIKVSE